MIQTRGVGRGGLLVFALFIGGCASGGWGTSREDPDFSAGHRFVDENLDGEVDDRSAWVWLLEELDGLPDESGGEGADLGSVIKGVMGRGKEYEIRRLEYGVSDRMSASGLYSSVIVKTREPGARINFQLIGRDAVLPSGELTNGVKETLPIGIYDMWAERDGEETGRVRRKRVVDELVPIEIVESLRELEGDG